MSAIRKWIVRSLAAMVVAAGSLVSLAGPAQAYDAGTCNGLFGAANIAGRDSVKIQAGHVDFGAGAHIAGFPLGTAVVCWSIDGRVAIVGDVFSDPGFHGDNYWATARIRLYKNGVGGTEVSVSTALANNLQSAHVAKVSGSGHFTRVRIRLSFTNETGVETFTSTSNEWR